MRFRALFILGFTALLGIANPVFAASPEDVQELASMVTDESVPALLRKTYFLPSGEANGYEAVFVCGGNRYTLYNSGERINPDDPQSAWLAFLVREDGTYGQETLDTFSDNGLDGTVDFGIDGPREREFIREFIPEGTYAMGDEHQLYWQQRLDAAVAALLKCNR